MSIARATKQLDELITLRSEIGNRVETVTSVKKKDVGKQRGFVLRLAPSFHNAVLDFLKGRVKRVGWHTVHVIPDPHAKKQQRAKTETGAVIAAPGV